MATYTIPSKQNDVDKFKLYLNVDDYHTTNIDNFKVFY